MNQTAPSVEEIFHAALELQSSAARAEFLDRVCGDTELRRRVERLLAVDARGDDFLEAPASMPTVTVGAGPSSDAALERPGAVIGPYKLLEQIGEGGMGTIYAIERVIKERREEPGDCFTDADAVRLRRTRAAPILARFGDWIEVQRRSATPKSLFGQAVEYSRNQWASLVRYLDDARFAIDNGEAERAIRPLAVGRSNWLHLGGDGGLKTAAVLLSVCGSATRHRLNPWTYLRDVLDQLAARRADADVSDLLPDAGAVHHARLDRRNCRPRPRSDDRVLRRTATPRLHPRPADARHSWRQVTVRRPERRSLEAETPAALSSHGGSEFAVYGFSRLRIRSARLSPGFVVKSVGCLSPSRTQQSFRFAPSQA